MRRKGLAMRLLKFILAIFFVSNSFRVGAETSKEIQSDRKLFKGSATLVIKSSKIEEFKKTLALIIEPTRHEVGCIRYEAFQLLDKDGNETNRFEFHELWRDEKAMLIDHKEKADHMKAFLKKLNIGAKNSMVESFSAGGVMAKEIMAY